MLDSHLEGKTVTYKVRQSLGRYFTGVHSLSGEEKISRRNCFSCFLVGSDATMQDSHLECKTVT